MEEKEKQCSSTETTAGRRLRRSSAASTASNEDKDAASATTTTTTVAAKETQPPTTTTTPPVRTRDVATRSSKRLGEKDVDSAPAHRENTPAKRPAKTGLNDDGDAAADAAVKTPSRKTEEPTFKPPPEVTEEKDPALTRRERRASLRRKRDEVSVEEEPRRRDSGSKEHEDPTLVVPPSREGGGSGELSIKEEGGQAEGKEEEKEEGGGSDAGVKLERSQTVEMPPPESSPSEASNCTCVPSSESKPEPMVTDVAKPGPTTPEVEDRKSQLTVSGSASSGQGEEGGREDGKNEGTVPENGKNEDGHRENEKDKESVGENEKENVREIEENAGEKRRNRENVGDQAKDKENVGEQGKNETEDGKRRERSESTEGRRDNGRERRKKDKFEHMREKILKIQLEQPEHRLIQMDDEIKRCLQTGSFDMARCLLVLEDLDDFPMDVNMLRDNPHIIKTIRQCRKFKISQEVKRKAEVIFNRWKDAFLSFDWPVDRKQEDKRTDVQSKTYSVSSNSVLSETAVRTGGGELRNRGAVNSSSTPVPLTTIASPIPSPPPSFDVAAAAAVCSDPHPASTTTTTTTSQSAVNGMETSTSERDNVHLPAEKEPTPDSVPPVSESSHAPVDRAESASSTTKRAPPSGNGSENTAVAAPEGGGENASPALGEVQGGFAPSEKSPVSLGLSSEKPAESSKEDVEKEAACPEESSSGERSSDVQLSSSLSSSSAKAGCRSEGGIRVDEGKDEEKEKKTATVSEEGKKVDNSV